MLQPFESTGLDPRNNKDYNPYYSVARSYLNINMAEHRKGISEDFLFKTMEIVQASRKCKKVKIVVTGTKKHTF